MMKSKKIAAQIAASTNIQIVESGSDYMLEIYAHEGIDHHDERLGYVFGTTAVWPSNQIKGRSAVEDEFGNEMMERRKLTKKIVIGLLTKTLQSQFEKL